MSEVCSVEVGIRIRPFNDRERKLGAQLCVDVDGPTTILRNVEEGAEPRRFTFDASFWSHDGFEEGADGYLSAAPGSRYADQRLVFETFGQKVLDNAWEGYHCCLFAYGQTGSGKSYSMVGKPPNRGIVPCACEEIFNRIQRQTDAEVRFEVTVSMIEIYNEAVQDLLIPPKQRQKGGLQLRESKQMGVYVQDAQRRAVDSYEGVEKVVAEGTANRSVGSTMMNATSSRAHTVLTIEFRQVRASGTKVSMINLVDLAGSEKVKQSEATGDRLREGCAINKSLSALGNVIEKLADICSGRSKDAVVPYRNSKLTRLLQNALGGSSKTVMICAISPASSNYEESLSTLRYADRAKRIKNAAVINENPQDRLIRSLQEENEKLKELVTGKVPGHDGSAEEIAKREAEIAALNEELTLQQRSFQERLGEAQRLAEQAAREQEAANLALPHLSNLNEDELLTNKVQFTFKEGRTRIGRASGGPEGPPDVALSGPGIQLEQAVVDNTGGVCLLTAVGPAAATTFVNGKSPAEGKSVSLVHGDRIAFGGSIFVFVDPSRGLGLADKLLESGRVSFAAAVKEVSQSSAELRSGPSEEELAESRRKAEELERQVRLAEEAKRRAELEANALLQQRESEYQAQIAALQSGWSSELQARAEAAASSEATAAEQARQHAEQLAALQRDFEERQRQAAEQAKQNAEVLERQAREAAAKEEDHRQEQINMQKLDEQLMHTLPLVKEANLIAEELRRPQRLQLKMRVELHGGRARNAVRVSAGVWKDGVELYEWTPETLENRVFVMRELLERCDDQGVEVADNLQNEEDPWWDPVKAERLIGIAQVILESLTEQLENEAEVRILSNEGRPCGQLRVEIWPVSKDGKLGIPDEDVLDDLLGSRMVILLRVVRATGLPAELATDVRIEYTYFIDDQPQQVPPVQGFCCDPEFKYEKTFVQDPVTSRFLQYIKTQNIAFYVYGRNVAAEQMQAETMRGLSSATADTAPGSTAQAPHASAQAYSSQPASAPPLAPTSAQSAPAPLQDSAQAPSAAPTPAAAQEQALVTQAPTAGGGAEAVPAGTAPLTALAAAPGTAAPVANVSAPAPAAETVAVTPLTPAAEPAAATKGTGSQCCSLQ